MTTQYPIVAGPSREELFDALRLRHEGRTVPITVEETHLTSRKRSEALTMKCERKIQVSVDNIGIENGSGESWILKLHDANRKLGSKHLEAYFNTKNRKGWIRQ